MVVNEKVFRETLCRVPLELWRYGEGRFRQQDADGIGLLFWRNEVVMINAPEEAFIPSLRERRFNLCRSLD
jgi:hypothetical protein